MTDVLSQAEPADTSPVADAGPQSIGDIASLALATANERQADRDAGKDVPAALPNLADRHRSEDGRFAPKPGDAAKGAPAAAPKAAVAAATPSPRDPAASVTEPAAGTANPAATSAAQPAAAAALQAPAKWSDADKAVFGQLPPEGQKLLSEVHGRLEADYTRKTQELADHRRQVEPFVSALGEHSDFLSGMSQRIGQAPARIAGDVFHLYRTLATGAPHEKAQALGWVAQNVAGIDLRALAGGQAQGQGQQPQPNVPEPILRELHDLRQRVGQFDQFRQVSEQEREQRESHSANQQIEAFRAAKDEQGRPKYPHFDAVQGLMGQHILAGRSIEDAYALAAKPITDALAARDAADATAREAAETRARETAAAEDKARADAVARARRAGGPRPTGSQPGLAPKRTIDDIARDAIERAGIR